MRMYKVLAAVAALAMISPFALAQDAKPKKDDRKTETKPEGGDAKDGKGSFDRGDEKAEKFFKRAYTRVNSAEEKGLRKLKAEADIAVDASAMGAGEFPFEGNIWWKSGGKATWEAVSDENADSNPMMGQLTNVAKEVFEPYLAYVTGFEAWDIRFKEASFKFGDPVMEGEGDKAKEVAKTVVVTYADDKRPADTFTVAENKVTSVEHDGVMGGQKARLLYSFEYEDMGDKLRLSSITGSSEIDVSGMPGQEPDPKNPVPKGATKEKLEGTIKVAKYGKAGEYEIALELEGSVSLMGMKFPASFTLSEAKVNDEVKDEDFPDGTEDEPSDDEF
ncbi:MAG: hypothetical protein K8I27_04620 [Planctomycetes bacterium]|nr:hypothetical protein [Planctomycetota bacterium]